MPSRVESPFPNPASTHIRPAIDERAGKLGQDLFHAWRVSERNSGPGFGADLHGARSMAPLSFNFCESERG
eukprot:7861142-Lingulodinium_polyedra.AAC.1